MRWVPRGINEYFPSHLMITSDHKSEPYNCQNPECVVCRYQIAIVAAVPRMLWSTVTRLIFDRSRYLGVRNVARFRLSIAAAAVIRCLRLMTSVELPDRGVQKLFVFRRRRWRIPVSGDDGGGGGGLLVIHRAISAAVHGGCFRPAVITSVVTGLVVLETADLVSRPLKTEILRSWSWSCYSWS